MKILTYLMLSLGLAHACAAEPLRASATGIYTDLSYNTQGGDLLGAEIFLFAGKGGYFVLFQSAQGEPNSPALVRAVVSGSKITFELPPTEDGYSGTFVGKIEHGAIKGAFSEGQQSPIGKKEFILKRGKSYWQR